MGDYNDVPDSAPVPYEAVEGRVVVVLPKLGRLAALFHTLPGTVVLIIIGLIIIEWPNIKELLLKANPEKEEDDNEKRQ